ncbi:6-pyruvoyl-tetrahydropterin synthase [Candidatus Methanoperedens nitroreducens]|uniref:6-pyruvoyl-tetrahydropterin synthase n=1 Tax=Candidatus Methanoperedens nitratireducens TaxID=1392998 RepID=A0A062V5U9_9EURY|nr:6-carboxytetrahydropterin synthase [Candidatus Methanoperedens nitroreducens]KCZ71189.1 6-pyruvoyl-tetrahydropterin synthase [Candidatus Methanoperedens nitroreducens]MDJ1421433.1 6-carboxytetrahydropterin synthase [Candidatus Methanoperedens sp.]
MFIEIDGWMAKMRFSACHFIPDHPKCGCLHGHTYAVSVRIEGEQIGEFLIDFEKVKKIVNSICDRLDHRVLIAEKDPRLRIERKEGISIEIIESKKRYLLPSEDVTLLPTRSASAEDLCKYFTSEIASALKSSGAYNIKSIQVRVDEGIGQGAGCELEM